MKRLFQFFLHSQYKLCKIFDLFFPAKMKIDGYRDFSLQVLPAQLEPEITVMDIGGGKKPVISADLKKRYKLKVIGLDISEQELKNAPEGIYDQIIVNDISQTRETAKADLIICLAVLEHVENTSSAMNGIASLLKSGGKALIFVPCRNSIFAQLNCLLPENLKKRILSFLFEESRGRQGFKSFYHQCTPSEIKKLAIKAGLEIEEEVYYFQSEYFSFFLPIHVIYRVLTCCLIKIFGNEAAETFTLILKKS